MISEDLVSPCTFDLWLPPLAGPQKGVLVLYERGDTDTLYHDDTLRQGLSQMQLAIVWAHECDAKSFLDLQADASKGPARMLFAALSSFAVGTGHPELGTANVILYGFSAAGVLTTTMANEHPDRLLGAIQYASGSAYVDLDDVPITAAASSIPRLVLANAEDNLAGTSRSLRYFQRGQNVQAAWAYAVQNGPQHCCTLSTRDLILPWIRAIVSVPSSTAKTNVSSGVLSHFVCTPDGVKDAQGEINCSFTSAELNPALARNPGGSTGWIPSLDAAEAWLAWVTKSP